MAEVFPSHYRPVESIWAYRRFDLPSVAPQSRAWRDALEERRERTSGVNFVARTSDVIPHAVMVRRRRASRTRCFPQPVYKSLAITCGRRSSSANLFALKHLACGIQGVTDSSCGLLGKGPGVMSCVRGSTPVLMTLCTTSSPAIVSPTRKTFGDVLHSRGCERSQEPPQHDILPTPRSCAVDGAQSATYHMTT